MIYKKYVFGHPKRQCLEKILVVMANGGEGWRVATGT